MTLPIELEETLLLFIFVYIAVFSVVPEELVSFQYDGKTSRTLWTSPTLFLVAAAGAEFAVTAAEASTVSSSGSRRWSGGSASSSYRSAHRCSSQHT